MFPPDREWDETILSLMPEPTLVTRIGRVADGVGNCGGKEEEDQMRERGRGTDADRKERELGEDLGDIQRCRGGGSP